MPATDYPYPSKAETRTWEFLQQSYKGHGFLTLPSISSTGSSDQVLYRDRFTSTSSSGIPISRLTSAETRTHQACDTVVYTLPTFNPDGRLDFFDEIWRSWYPLRPTSCRSETEQGVREWSAGRTFFGVPVKVGFASEEGEGALGKDQLLGVLGQLRAVQSELALAVEREKGQMIKSGKVRGPDYYEKSPNRSFALCFVVADELTKGEDGWRVLLALGEEQAGEQGLDDEDEKVGEVPAVDGGQGNWSVWRVQLEKAVSIVARIDDEKRVAEKAALSREYVARFGEDGASVKIGSKKIPGIVSD